MVLVKVSAVTQFAERLCEKGVRHIKAPSRRSPREVQLLEGRHRLGDEYLVKLKGIGDRDSANKLRGSVLYARQTERPKDVADDEFDVQTYSSYAIGKIRGILSQLELKTQGIYRATFYVSFSRAIPMVVFAISSYAQEL